MTHRKFKKDIINNLLSPYYDDDLIGYYDDSIPILTTSQVENLLSRALKEYRKHFISEMGQLFEKYSKNGFSKESIDTLRDFCSKLEKI